MKSGGRVAKEKRVFLVIETAERQHLAEEQRFCSGKTNDYFSD